MINKIKRLLSVIMILVFSSLLLIGCSSNSETKKSKEKYSGTIDVWSWNNELLTSGIIEKFNKKYPDVRINLICIPNDNNAYTTKLIATLRSGVRTPDVYLAESAAVKKLCNMDYYEDLTKSPYNVKELTDKMVPYTVDISKNDKDGSVRALTWQATPGGFFYRRSLAKKYLGTDDPDTISSMMKNWNDFIELGKKIKSQSNGSVSFLADYSELLYPILGSRKSGWVTDGKLTIDDAVINYLDLAQQIRGEGLDKGAKQWTENWSNSMQDGSVFGYMLPTWGLSSVLQADAPDTSGDWAFVQAPTSYYWGGSWIGMYKDSKKKDLAWLFIKYITTNEDFLKDYAKDSGDFVNNTDVQDEISNSSDGNNKFLNNENVYSQYSKLVPNINGNTLTEYDEKINSDWIDTVDMFISNKISKDDVVPQFKNKVKEDFPDIKVD